MEEASLLAELAPAAASLLDRHLSATREWFPHDLVPWQRAADRDRIGRTPATLSPGLTSALLVNVLTEDALPYYVVAIRERFADDGPWWDWLRRWTAEEQRHSIVLRDYLVVTNAVDLVELERARMTHLASATVPDRGSALRAFVYLAIQELATRIAHHNTGQRLDDEDGSRLMLRIAVDENLHHLFYRDLVTAALEVDPSATVEAIAHEVRHFAMPGMGIPSFVEHSRAIADDGIFTAVHLLEQVFVPLVHRTWSLDSHGGLSPQAEHARERCFEFLDRLARIAPRMSAVTDASPVGGGEPGGGS